MHATQILGVGVENRDLKREEQESETIYGLLSQCSSGLRVYGFVWRLPINLTLGCTAT